MFEIDRVPRVRVSVLPETPEFREHSVAVRGQIVQRDGDHGRGRQCADKAEQDRARPRGGQVGRAPEGDTVGGETGGACERDGEIAAVLEGPPGAGDVHDVRDGADDEPRTAQGTAAGGRGRVGGRGHAPSPADRRRAGRRATILARDRVRGAHGRGHVRDQPDVLAQPRGRRVRGRDDHVARRGTVPASVHRARDSRFAVRAAGVLLRARRPLGGRGIGPHAHVDGDGRAVPRTGRRAVRARAAAARRPHAGGARGRGVGVPRGRGQSGPVPREQGVGRARLRQPGAQGHVPRHGRDDRPLAQIVFRAALSAARARARRVRRTHG